MYTLNSCRLSNHGGQKDKLTLPLLNYKGLDRKTSQFSSTESDHASQYLNTAITYGDLRVWNPVRRSNTISDPVCHYFCRFFAIIGDSVGNVRQAVDYPACSIVRSLQNWITLHRTAPNYDHTPQLLVQQPAFPQCCKSFPL